MSQSADPALKIGRIQRAVAEYRERNSEANAWAAGFGPIQHSLETQARVFALVDAFAERDLEAPLLTILNAADRVASAAMWIVLHAAYTRSADPNGKPLSAEAFKEPHLSALDALRMVPAYMGYMAANAIAGITRAWIMGPGHCVPAVDAINLLLNNLSPAQAERYSFTREGLARYLEDFASATEAAWGSVRGAPSLVGSYVNAHTAGAILQGACPGLAELQYVHMPLPGERLVAFLSDDGFEAQRGADWPPLWWRAEDSGVVTPFLIPLRHEGSFKVQRPGYPQALTWASDFLRLNGFEPLAFDGTDPAAYTWAIFEMEFRLEAAVEQVRARDTCYPIALPHGIAVAPQPEADPILQKPLQTAPGHHKHAAAIAEFNAAAARWFVPPDELTSAIRRFQNHQISGREREREHCLTRRDVRLRHVPQPGFRPLPTSPNDVPTCTSPLSAIDAAFLSVVEANPHLRPRVACLSGVGPNPLERTLGRLGRRVGVSPATSDEQLGAVIEAVNEEAMACAAFGNKGGINLILTTEAAGVRMQRAIHQEIAFAAQCQAAGRPPRWLSLPIVVAHDSEGSLADPSLTDTAFIEAMLLENPNVIRVLFVPDASVAAAAVHEVFLTQGSFWLLVVPGSGSIPEYFSGEDAARLLETGALRIGWAGHQTDQARVILTAIGSRGLEDVLEASTRLAARNVPHAVNYLMEPARLRTLAGAPANDAAAVMEDLFPSSVPARIFVTHTRPEPMHGLLGSLHTGHGRTSVLGRLRGEISGKANGSPGGAPSDWRDIVAETGRLLGISRMDLLEAEERS